MRKEIWSNRDVKGVTMAPGSVLMLGVWTNDPWKEVTRQDFSFNNQHDTERTRLQTSKLVALKEKIKHLRLKQIKDYSQMDV